MEERAKRKLSAILSADVKGYSRLMGEDEEATVRTLKAYRELIAELTEKHRGRIVDSPGDNVLAEFSSVVDGVRCAVEIQEELKVRNAELPEERRMEFRIGVNLGDVIEDEERLYGDGVNIAARVEGLAEGGGICISGSAYEQVRNKLTLGYEYLGEHTVKNIAQPVKMYRVLMEPEAAGKVIGEERPSLKQWRWAVISAVVVLIIVVGALAIWHFYFRPSVERASVERMAFPLPDKPSIAVMPFDNMSGDPEQEYFSDGMSEDLITDLSKLSGLFVIARHSSFAYKGKAVKISQIAEELGVRYVLEGSVRKAGDQVRINAQLIDATTGHHLWAERYDGRMGNIFALQDKVTQKIVGALAVKLTPGEQQHIGAKGTDNVAAYDAFLRGWDHYLRLTPDDIGKAASYFKKAIEQDPNYGRAYAALALVYWHGTRGNLYKGLGISWFEARARACQYLHMAMKNPTSIAHNVQSQMYLFKRMHEKAISEAKRALALDPNNPRHYTAMADALNMAGRPKEGMDYAKRGMRLDPRNPDHYLVHIGLAHFCLGEMEEAANFFEDAIRHNPEYEVRYLLLAASYAHLGRDQEARVALDTYEKGRSGNVPFVLRPVMYFWPFKDRVVGDRFAEGLLKAGLPGQLSDYFHLFKENMLTGDEIRALIFGSTMIGVTLDGRQWSFERNTDGEVTSRGGRLGSDRGKSRIENDMVCTQMQRAWWGIEYCSTVFRNPNGTTERKDEYVIVSDWAVIPFSLGR
jgi:adenylate cyclase